MPRRFEGGCSPAIDMFEQVTQIARLHQYADVCELDDDKKSAILVRERAALKGNYILSLTEVSDGYQRALDRTLEWLRGRDFEMHKLVQGSLDQAKAVRDANKRARMNGKALKL